MIKVKIVTMKRILFISLLALLILPSAFSESTICRIAFDGNRIISDATVLSKIKIRAGQAYNDNIVNEDIKSLIATGFFEDVEVERDFVPEGAVIKFKLREKPLLKKVTIEGARRIRRQKIEKEISLKDGSFVDDYALSDAANKIRDLYRDKGFTQASVSHSMIVLDSQKNEVEVKFIIEERAVLKVRGVDIAGINSISPRRIKRLMKVKKKWLFNRGVFNESSLSDDVKRITDFYRQKGFADVKVNTDIRYDEKGVFVTVKINEGEVYHIGSIIIEGNRDIELDELISEIQLKEGDIFSHDSVYQVSSKLREIYFNRGYIFSAVDPISSFNEETNKVDVAYKIVENNVAHIARVNITGNARTKDEVIRRELRVYPNERFDGAKVKKSKERLDNLDFFEEVRIGAGPSSEPDWVDLNIDVKEARTGHFSFGGGYSSVDELVGFVEVRQRNFDYKNLSTFTGAGQDLSAYFSMGTVTQQLQLSFTNPWIFDRPISFGFDAYKKGHQREEDVGYGYEKDIRGGVLRLGREFSDRLKGGIGYRLETVTIGDVIDTASDELKSEVGRNDLSSLETNLAFDTRDNVFSPTKGIYFYNFLKFTGGPLAGDKDYFKYIARLSHYILAVNQSVLEFRVRGGIADPFSSTEKIPIYDRFFAGGADTIRGYNERKVGPIDPVTEDPIGGEALFVGNIEFTYPVADFVKAAVFFDTGNVWKDKSDFFQGGFKSSIGLGLRVKTPVGPVSIDYGWPLNTEPGEEEKGGKLHFSVSRGF
ncbi:MAG: outer membrane protein assembly factor BamA [Candidatus Omnitrophota bacterium]